MNVVKKINISKHLWNQHSLRGSRTQKPREKKLKEVKNSVFQNPKL